MANPFDFLRQLVSNSPEYQETSSYLMNRNALPNAQDSQYGILPNGTLGEFRRNLNRDTGKLNPRNGKITLSDLFLLQPTEAAAPAYMHELTHASNDELERQRKEKVVSSWRDLPPDPTWGLLPHIFTKLPDSKTQEQFNAAYDKLMPKENPKSSYRLSADELFPFAVGNVMTPDAKKRIQPLSDHQDATTATEYRILLDLANRSAKANPNKTKR